MSWDAQSLHHLSDQDDLAEVSQFLTLCPWEYARDGHSHFCGIETAWLIVLGFILVVGALPEDDDTLLSAGSRLSPLIKSYRDYLWDLRREFAHPGTPPSMKYAVAPSRIGYLYIIFEYNDSLLHLLSLVQRLVSTDILFPVFPLLMDP